MLKALLATGAAVVVVAGCVSVSGPSSAPPSTLHGPGASVAATAPAESAPIASAPQISPTASPTHAAVTVPPSAPPTPPASPAPSPDAATGDLLAFDEMDDGASGWAQGEIGSSSVTVVDGNLRLSVGDARQAIWSSRRLPGEFGVLLLAAKFTFSEDAGVGTACVTANNELYGAEITTDGQLIFFSIVGGVTAALDQHEIDIDFSAGDQVVLGLECAGTSTGALRLVPIAQDQGALGVYQSDNGPEAFIGAGLYGEALGEPTIVDVNQAVSYGIPGSADRITAEGQTLLTHVPPDWQGQCVDTPSTNSAIAVASCFLQTEGTGVELAIFQQHPDADAMNVAYQDVVELFGVEPEGDCEKGPNETTWRLGDAVGGRLQCAPQGVGIRFDWTDDELNVLSTLFDFDGDYKNTFRLWEDAGPF